MSANEVKIYIIIPIFNAEKYLNICLESISKQTFRNFTCIMVNDGSKDSSKEICENFTDDKRFVLLNQENKGVSTARNNGIKYALENACDDDFITFVDADDFLSESCFEKVVFAANNNPDNHDETLYICGWNQLTKTEAIHHKFEKNTSVLSCSLKDDFESLDIHLNFVWGNFYSAKQLKINKILFEESMNLAEDVEFNMRFVYFVKQFIFINECLYNYLESQNSLSRPEVYPPERISIFISIFIKRFKFLNENEVKTKNIFSINIFRI